MRIFRPRVKLGQPLLTLRVWRFTGSAILNLILFSVVAAYLSPLAYMFVTSVKGEEQVNAGPKAPIYPAYNPKVTYQGVDYPVMEVPTADGIKDWALISTPKRGFAEFIDPQDPARGLIPWQGNWYVLKKVFVPGVTFGAFTSPWKDADIPRGAMNALIVIGITEIGLLASSIAVAYGFSRFRIPGGKWLFFVLIATILIPDSITLLPTYAFYVNLLYIWLPRQTWLQFAFQLPWNWLPLIAPHFFSSAIYVFLLRQNFLSIPRDVDEAAMLDGAGPLRILLQIILPQSVPVVATVAMLHFFYMWNEFRLSSLYMGLKYDFWLLAPRLQYPITTPGVSAEAALQAKALILLAIPVLILLVFQRFFMQDMAVTGTEK